MIELDLFEKSTMEKTCDQSDFAERRKFNKSFESAFQFDRERIDNDQVYKSKFCYKLLSMINERWVPTMELEENYTTYIMTRVMEKLHLEIFEQKYFDFESNIRRNYHSFSYRMEDESRRIISVN